jgi:hypothetical protein
MYLSRIYSFATQAFESSLKSLAVGGQARQFPLCHTICPGELGGEALNEIACCPSFCKGGGLPEELIAGIALGSLGKVWSSLSLFPYL